MKKKLLAFMLAVSPSVFASDYCNGEWSDDAQAYCDGMRIFVTATYVDANMGVPLEESMKNIPEAVKTYMLPEAFVHNLIIYTYDQVMKDHGLSSVAVSLEGACIDNYKELYAEGFKDAAHLYAEEMGNKLK